MMISKRSPISVPTLILLLLLGLLNTQQYHTANAITSHPNIIHLTDENFEHETQASTGMTTGSWFLFFHAPRCPHCQMFSTPYELLATELSPENESSYSDEEGEEEDEMEGMENVKGVVFGMINVLQNKVTSARFFIRGFPTILYLHQKQMYTYQMTKSSPDKQLIQMKQFLIAVHSGKMEGMPIPTPPSALEQFKKTLGMIAMELVDAAKGKQGSAGYAMLVFLGVTFALFFGLLSICFMPSKSNVEKKKN